MARRSFQRTGHKRATFWGRSPADTAVTALAAGVSVIDSSAGTAVGGMTLVRTRGHISVSTDQQIASEDLVGAVGLCIVSDEAFAAGVSAVPTPYTDQDSELWVMHQYFSQRSLFRDATGFTPNAATTWEFDSKAMRKMEFGQSLIFVVENGGTFGFNYWLNFATLLKLA